MKSIFVWASALALLALIIFFLCPNIERMDAFWLAAGIILVIYAVKSLTQK